MKWILIFVLVIIATSILPLIYAAERYPEMDVICKTVDITAYSPSPHITMGDPFVTASKRKVKPSDLEQLKFVAVSRDLMKLYGLEYGDTIWISFTVEDIMHRRIENTVDLFMRSLDLARKFGRQKRQIIIRRN